jgi:5-methylcytosine-specific restriction endonuclease McrA
MARALVLNATYEPLSVVSTLRALVLVLDDKAECVLDTERVLHSEYLAVPEPSVVRLNRYIHVPHTHRSVPNRRTVFARDDGACQYCGSAADSVDHIVPRSRGGAHTWDNVVAACRRCNGRKRDRLLAETGMRLRRPPSEPGPLTLFRAAAGPVPATWAPFLDEGRRRSA